MSTEVYYTDAMTPAVMGKLHRKMRLAKVIFPEPPGTHEPVPRFLKEMLVTEDATVRGELRMESPDYPSLDRGSKMLWMWQAAGMQQFCRYGKRLCYVDMPTCHDLLNTDSMSHVYGSDVVQPYPALLLSVPRQIAADQFVSYDGESHVHKMFVSILDEDLTVHTLGRDMFMQSGKEQGGRVFLLNAVWQGREKGVVQSVCLPIMNDRTIGSVWSEHEHNWVDAPDMDKVKHDKDEIDWDMLVSRNMADFALNALLYMQTYPKYVEKEMHKCRVGKGKTKSTEDIEVLTLISPSDISLGQTVSTDPSKPDTSTTGRKMPTHHRKAHWRRQRHSPRWESDNPEAKIIVMPNGGHAHLVRIGLTKVNDPRKEGK